MCKTESSWNSTQRLTNKLKRPLKPKPVVEDDLDNDEEEESGEDEQMIMCSHTCVKRWFWPGIDSTLCIQYYI